MPMRFTLLPTTSTKRICAWNALLGGREIHTIMEQSWRWGQTDLGNRVWYPTQGMGSVSEHDARAIEGSI